MKQKKKPKFNWNRIAINLVVSGFVILLVLDIVSFKMISDLKDIEDDLWIHDKVILQAISESNALRDEIMFENDLRHTRQIEELYGMCSEN